MTTKDWVGVAAMLVVAITMVVSLIIYTIVERWSK